MDLICKIYQKKQLFLHIFMNKLKELEDFWSTVKIDDWWITWTHSTLITLPDWTSFFCIAASKLCFEDIISSKIDTLLQKKDKE